MLKRYPGKCNNCQWSQDLWRMLSGISTCVTSLLTEPSVLPGKKGIAVQLLFSKHHKQRCSERLPALAAALHYLSSEKCNNNQEKKASFGFCKVWKTLFMTQTGCMNICVYQLAQQKSQLTAWAKFHICYSWTPIAPNSVKLSLTKQNKTKTKTSHQKWAHTNKQAAIQL